MSNPWKRVGGAAGGAVLDLAVSPSFARDNIAFAATLTGLHRSDDGGGAWRRVGPGDESVSIGAVAVSPTFDQDGLVLAAALSGSLYRVTDNGALWRAVQGAGRTIQTAALAISPHFAHDAVAFAATMGDGVLVSRDRAAHWEACTFGLLDLDVHVLAISPQYERDETVCAATSTGIYRSQNGGRAWREMAPPAGSALVQCLAIAPDTGAGAVFFAGTDGAGIFRSLDRGGSWHPLDESLRDACINGLALSPTYREDHTMLAIAESGVYVSRDAGERWACCGQAPGALCITLTSPGGPALAGLARGGVWRSTDDLSRWEPAAGNVAARRLTGLTLSPALASDGAMVTYGVGEGVYRSADYGRTWADDDGLPSSGVTDMASAILPDGSTALYAALPEGIWRRRWGAAAWEQVYDQPVRLLAFPPPTAAAAGAPAVIARDDGTLMVARDDVRRWHPLDVPWRGKEILAVSMAPAGGEGHVFVAVGASDGARVEVWRGTVEGRWARAVEHEGAIRHAAIALPPSAPWDGSWYAAIAAQFYGPMAVAPGQPANRTPAGYAIAPGRPTIGDLAVLPGASGVVAATAQGMYHLAPHAREWRRLSDDDGPRAVVAIEPALDGSVYALELGGTVWRLSSPLRRGQPLHSKSGHSSSTRRRNNSTTSSEIGR